MGDSVDAEALFQRIVSSLHVDITKENLCLIERHYSYSKVAARLLLDRLVEEVMERPATRAETVKYYPELLARLVERGVAADRLDPALRGSFDLKALGAALRPERDDML
ncbi:MAG: ribonucleoside-diphosphate reductase subunit alpha, partial [Ectothiorhodospiraceae bacterium AqS1]|nr:ribonucleoside-diphosphate reductase subunit alpha [Ectothiorhodospiraceae bacterium AqS1]